MRRNRPRRIALAAVAAAMLVCGWTAPAALAHAQLLGTSPTAASTVPTEPRQVIFEFNQNVGGTLGAVRVYDAQGNQVDDLAVTHPGGDQRWMGVGLKPGLPDGTYTATYRVVSADTHIVYGGMVFNIGRAGATPRFTVAGLIGRNEAGEITRIAFGVVRTLDYITIALMVGGLMLAFFVWAPALGADARRTPEWHSASAAFASRTQRMLVLTAVAGALVSVLGVLLQGASAAGTSLWSSLKSAVLENTLESRFGEVWTVRAGVWILLGAVLLLARASARGSLPTLAPGAGDAPAGASVRLPARPILALLTLACAYLILTPALAGHASTQSPTGVFFPIDAVHVLSASVWVGGIACLLLALPAATRRLDEGDRTSLLLATLRGFSTFALAAVVAISLTGVVQAYIDVRSFSGLFHTTYGALVLVKSGLLLVLIAIGWSNRERIIPALQARAAAHSSPGGPGLAARRNLRAESALMLCVFGVTAALVSYAPPIDAASGPFSANTRIGPAELEMTVEPARVGPNAIHLYLIDAKSGVQFTGTKELTATARLPSRHIGPLPLKATLAGPGHYVFNSAVLSPGGTWEIEIVDRVSEFEQNTRVVNVPIH